MQLNNELMILTRMESWGVNALVTSQLHLMANQTAMELQKTHSELFIFENKASSSCIYSALMSAWTCSESLMVCVLIIKRLIWYLFMFVFFWCWLFVVIVRVVSVAISGSLLTPCLLLTLSQLQIVLINKHPPDTNHSLGVNIIMTWVHQAGGKPQWVSRGYYWSIPGKYWE